MSEEAPRTLEATAPVNEAAPVSETTASETSASAPVSQTKPTETSAAAPAMEIEVPETSAAAPVSEMTPSETSAAAPATEIEAPETSAAAPVSETTPSETSADAPAVEMEAPITSAPTPMIEKPRSMDDLRVGMALQGKIKRIELYGAFVDVGIGTDGLLHISQLGRPNVRNVEDVVKAGESHVVYVLRFDPANRRIALSLEQPPATPWEELSVGKVVTGKVIRMEKYGVFIDIGAERAGMIHVSELAAGYVNQPSDVVNVGDEVQAQIIKINPKQKRIDLSIKKLQEASQPERPDRSERFERGAERSSERPPRQRSERSGERSEPRQRIQEDVPAEDRAPTAMEFALRRAMDTTTTNVEIPMPSREDKTEKKRGKRDRKDRRDRHEDYEDIFERTLRGR